MGDKSIWPKKMVRFAEQYFKYGPTRFVKLFLIVKILYSLQRAQLISSQSINRSILTRNLFIL